VIKLAAPDRLCASKIQKQLLFIKFPFIWINNLAQEANFLFLFPPLVSAARGRIIRLYSHNQEAE
jgi:hypothetical protein